MGLFSGLFGSSKSTSVSNTTVNVKVNPEIDITSEVDLAPVATVVAQLAKEQQAQTATLREGLQNFAAGLDAGAEEVRQEGAQLRDLVFLAGAGLLLVRMAK